jgi:hypothetical protein
VNWKSGAALLVVLAGVGAVLALRSGPLNDFLNMTPYDTAYWRAIEGQRVEAPPPPTTSPPGAETPPEPGPEPTPPEGTGGVWRVLQPGRPYHHNRWSIRTRPGPVFRRVDGHLLARAWLRTEVLRALPATYDVDYTHYEFDCSTYRYREVSPDPSTPPEQAWIYQFGEIDAAFPRASYAACGAPMRKLVDGSPRLLSRSGGRSLFHLTYPELRGGTTWVAFWVEERFSRPARQQGRKGLIHDRVRSLHGFECAASRPNLHARRYLLGSDLVDHFDNETSYPGDGGTPPEVYRLGRKLCRQRGIAVGPPDPEALVIDALTAPLPLRFREAARGPDVVSLAQVSPRPMAAGPHLYLWRADRPARTASVSAAGEERTLYKIDCRIDYAEPIDVVMFAVRDPYQKRQALPGLITDSDQDHAFARWACRRFGRASLQTTPPAGKP